MEPLPERSFVSRVPPWISPELAQSLHQSLRFAYEFGLLGREEAAEVLGSYVLRDVDGKEWTIGATSGRWYWRSEGEDWAWGEPPPALKPPDLDLSQFAVRRPSASTGEPVPVGAAPGPPIDAASAGGLACPSCGARLAAGQRFCIACGGPVSATARPAGLCPACGARNAGGGRFCVSCGASLAG